MCSVTSADHTAPNWKIIIGSCFVERKLECDTRSFPSHNWRKRKNNSKSWIKIGRISSCKSLSLIGCLLGTNLKALFSEPTILDDWMTNKKLKLNFVKLHKQLWIKKLKMFWIKVWLITYDSFRMTSGWYEHFSVKQMENDLSESDKLRKLQEETLSRIRLECSNVEAKNIEKEQGSTDHRPN